MALKSKPVYLVPIHYYYWILESEHVNRHIGMLTVYDLTTKFCVFQKPYSWSTGNLYNSRELLILLLALFFHFSL